MNFNAKSLIGLSISIGVVFLELFSSRNAKVSNKTGKKQTGYVIISGIATIVYLLYMVADALCAEGIITSILPWIEKHFYFLSFFVFVAAIVPNVAARIEYKKGTFNAKEEYLSGNLRLNLCGAFAVSTLLVMMRMVIGNLNTLKGFYINDVLPGFAPVCMYMVLLYQKTEQKRAPKELDHDPSLEHINQMLNMFYLFNTFFLGLIPVIYIVTYTIYSQMYHMTLPLNNLCLVLLSAPLIFFYGLSKHQHRDLYLISIITIPIILIGSAYWMSFLSQSLSGRICQWLFIVLHSIVYMLLIFKKENVVTIRKYVKTGKWKLTSKYSDLLFVPIVILIIYGLIWILPHSTDRLPANEAYKIIETLCYNTDVDAESVIEQAQAQPMYDEANKSYDVEKFMKYLSEMLGVQLVDKGVIKAEGDIPMRRALENWYWNLPPHTYMY